MEQPVTAWNENCSPLYFMAGVPVGRGYKAIRQKPVFSASQKDPFPEPRQDPRGKKSLFLHFPEAALPFTSLFVWNRKVVGSPSLDIVKS